MIQFHCYRCHSLLRTPAGTEGQRAKCPQCGAVMDVPAGGAAVDSGAGDSARHSDVEAPAASAAPRNFRPTPIEIGPTFDRAWQLYKDHFALVAGGGALVVFLMMFVDQVVQRIFGTNPSSFWMGYDIHANSGPLAARQFLGAVITQGVHSYFWIGLIVFTLKIARGERAELADLFSAGPLFLPGLAVHWLVLLLVGVGALFCLIPGIWLGLTFGMSLYMLVDQRTSIPDSFRYSARATRGNKFELLGLLVAAVFLLVVVTFFTCGLGFFLFAPFGVLLATVAYLTITGQLPETAPEQAMPQQAPA